MNDDLPPAPSIPRWPFWAGDALLLLVVVIMALNHEGPPNPFTLLFGAFLVVLGACLICIPIILEHFWRTEQNRVTETQFHRYIRQRLESLQGGLIDLGKSSREHGEMLEHIGAKTSSLPGEWAQAITTVEEALNQLEQNLGEKLTRIEEATPENPASIDLSSLENRLGALEAQLEAIQSDTRSLLERAATPEAAAILAGPEESDSTDAGEPAPSAPSSSEEPGLMKRALSRKTRGAHNGGVSRLIRANQKPDESEEDVPAEAPVEHESVFAEETPEPDIALENTEPEDVTAATDTDTEATDTPSEETDGENQTAAAEETVETESTADEAEPSIKDETVNNPSAEPEPEEVAAEPVRDNGPEQPALLADLPEPIRKSRTVRGKGTTLIANLLIGIGNKPYVRGEGPGLSPDKGIPMEFVEIGKWRWTTGEATGPVTCSILKNDTVAAEGDPIVIEPGQTIEIHPSFKS
jgi:hypothetical protein